MFMSPSNSFQQMDLHDLTYIICVMCFCSAKKLVLAEVFASRPLQSTDKSSSICRKHLVACGMSNFKLRKCMHSALPMGQESRNKRTPKNPECQARRRYAPMQPTKSEVRFLKKCHAGQQMQWKHEHVHFHGQRNMSGAWPMDTPCL